MPVKKTRIGELAVPARKATTKAKITGFRPMAGSMVNWSPYQKAARPHSSVPMKKQTREIWPESMPMGRASSGLGRVALMARPSGGEGGRRGRTPTHPKLGAGRPTAEVEEVDIQDAVRDLVGAEQVLAGRAPEQPDEVLARNGDAERGHEDGQECRSAGAGGQRPVDEPFDADPDERDEHDAQHRREPE